MSQGHDTVAQLPKVGAWCTQVQMHQPLHCRCRVTSALDTTHMNGQKVGGHHTLSLYCQWISLHNPVLHMNTLLPEHSSEWARQCCSRLRMST